MQTSEIFLLAAYLISGISTYWVLNKYKMHFAKTAYTVAFIVLLSYFPICSGYNFMYYLVGERLLPESEPFMYNGLIEPLTHISPYMNFSIIIIIALSLFFSVSIVVLAWQAAKAIYNLVIKKKDLRYKFKVNSNSNFSKSESFIVLPPCFYRYIFCKYNC